MTRSTTKRPAARGRITAWLAWFLALNVLWLVLISAWVAEEEILGLFAAALAATAAEAVREQGLAGFRVRGRWLWRARVLPWRAVRETGVVLAALARQLTGHGPVRGRFRVVPVALPTDAHEQAAKRALITAAESFAPNAYVLAIDNRAGLMLVHELVAEGEE
jgi:multisubunit Na+/H+ antiporter MnhE subunit